MFFTLYSCAKEKTLTLTLHHLYLWCYLLSCRNLKMFSPMSYLPVYLLDTEYRTVITMARAPTTSGTRDIYFTYTKVNPILYACSLDPFEDGILLDTPLVCMHRYCQSFTDDEEECKRRGTPRPSVREAWKRRRKKEREEVM